VAISFFCSVRIFCATTLTSGGRLRAQPTTTHDDTPPPPPGTATADDAHTDVIEGSVT